MRRAQDHGDLSDRVPKSEEDEQKQQFEVQGGMDVERWRQGLMITFWADPPKEISTGLGLPQESAGQWIVAVLVRLSTSTLRMLTSPLITRYLHHVHLHVIAEIIESI